MRSSPRWISFILSLALIGTSCGLERSNSYAQSSDGSLSFRYPVNWTEVEVEPVATEWVVGIDASSVPSAENQNAASPKDPFVMAQVLELEPEFRQTASIETLRTLSLTDRRDPLSIQDGTIEMLFHESYLDERGFEGHHMRFAYQTLEGRSVTEHFAVFDPGRISVQRVWINCTAACFDTHMSSIEDVFESVRLR